jgi:5-dehydro-2-deoxygluconokinase
VYALAIPALAQARQPPGEARGSSVRFELLAVRASAQVAAGRAGFGVLLDGTPDPAALGAAQDNRLWVAQQVAQDLSRPLEFAGAASLAAHLVEWPTGLTVACRCHYNPEDPRELRDAQERNLLRLAAACQAQGRELLLEISVGGGGGLRKDTDARVLSRFYELGIRPDWWALEPGPRGVAWESCARVIGGSDPYCRGVLLVLRGPIGPKAPLLAAAAASPVVRGFMAGGSIFEDLAPAWLTEQMAAESLTAGIAERFHALVEAWIGVRDPRLDHLERGGH